jgi:hypothetical protein
MTFTENLKTERKQRQLLAENRGTASPSTITIHFKTYCLIIEYRKKRDQLFFYKKTGVFVSVFLYSWEFLIKAWYMFMIITDVNWQCYTI